MRGAALAFFVSLAACTSACGELSGATELVDGARPFEPGSVDTGMRPDTGPRPDGEASDASVDAVSTEPALAGDYFHERIPPTRGVFRLDRRSASGQPLLVVISLLRKVRVTCDAFKGGPTWALPAGAVVHRIELGSMASGVYTVRPHTETLLVDGAIAGRIHAGEADYDWADRGTVTVTSADATGSRGALDVKFDFWFEEDQMTEQAAVGDFDAIACDVP